MKKQYKPMNTERLQLRISKEQLETIKKAAAKHSLSVSSYVRMILKKYAK